MFNPSTFKQHFPLFQQEKNQSLAYLDNAATTQKPQSVIDAICHFYSHNNANANRSSHRLAREATDTIETCRQKAAFFLSAKSKEEVAFTRGATESLNMIAFGLQHQLQAGDIILTKHNEHHANLLPWQQTALATGAQLHFCSTTLSQELENLDIGLVKVLTISLASNALGTVADMDELNHIKNKYPNIILVLDATQYIAHRPVNVQQLNCDFLVCSAHKFFGPTCIGLLFARKSLLATLEPLLTGGEMVAKVGPQKSQFNTNVSRLEAGTSAMSAIAGLSACFDFWQQWDRQLLEAHEQNLLAILHQKIHAVAERFTQISVLTEAKNNIGIAAIAVQAPFSVADMGIFLDENNIAVRVGQHCAQLLWSHSYRNQYTESLRLSIAAYNTVEDIEKAISSVEDYCAIAIDNNQQSNNQKSNNQKRNNDSQNREIDEFDFSSLDWEKLSQTRNWQARYKLLLQWGKRIPTHTSMRCDEHLVSGCEASVWLSHKKYKDTHYFQVDSDSTIVKALAALILSRCHKHSSEHILSVDFQAFFVSLELEKHLSPSRNNGLHALYQKVMSYITADV